MPPTQVGSGPSELRYEDVSQDGRLMLLAMPHALGEVVWRRLLAQQPAAKLAHTGVIPILTRFVIEGGEGPTSVRGPVEGEGRYALAHARGDDGAVRHLFMNMWCRLYARRGRTHGPPPDGAGERIFVGRVFAEHVFTRLFAPKGERQVTRLDAPGLPPVPEARWTMRPLEAVLALPDGARALDAAPVDDPAEVVFGLEHTDSNQHVNSLVYPRLIIDAALRRFAAHGRDPRVLARRLEVFYRKPCFAGETVRLRLRAFEHGADLGVLATVVPADRPDGPPHCAAQLRFAL